MTDLEPHVFVPRKHGSKDACGHPRCGARKDDPVHVLPHKPKETRR